MSSADTRGGVLHPRSPTALRRHYLTLSKPLRNSINLVKSFIEADNKGIVSGWADVKYTWKAEEVERWSRQLSDQKLTLNIAIVTANLINAGNISTTSARAAKDIQELKTNLKELLLDMKRMRSLYVEHNVVSSNYRSAIKRPVGETASLSSGPSHKIPDSPDMGVSAIVSTEASTVFYSISTAASLKEALINDENSAFITAPSLQSSSTSCSASVGNSVHAYAVAAERNQKSPASSVSQNYGAVVNQSALADRDLDGISHLPGYEQLHLGTRSLGSYSGEEVSTQQRYAGYLKSLFQTKFRKRSITESSFPQKQARAINVTYLPSYGWMINVQDIMLWIDLGRITE